MAIIYGDKDPPPAFPIRFDRMDPHKQWLKHYGNYLFLKFMVDHPQTNPMERRQANKEIVIAQRKLDYWAKHPVFNAKNIITEKNKIRATWNLQQE